jgi:ribosome production factor 1
MVKEKKIANAFKRSEVHRKAKRDKEQEKLKRRMDIRKAEQGEGGAELKKVCLCLCLSFALLPPSQQWRKALSTFELTSSNDLPRMFPSHSIIVESTILRVTSLPTPLLGGRQLNGLLKLLEQSTVR